MQTWNIIVTVVPGPHHESTLIQRLRDFGEFHFTKFPDVLLGRVTDVPAFLEALRAAREQGKKWIAALGRVVPVEHIFCFTPETLTEQFKQAATCYMERLRDGSSLHVRLERRGLAGVIDTPRVEREVGDKLFTLAGQAGKTLHVSFKDPDYIVVAETVGEECGVALLDRELRSRYPFVQAR